MHGGELIIKEIPKMGFCHHFYADKEYYSDYGRKKGIEIVYVKSGNMICELYGKTFIIEEGDVFVLFRHLPVKIRTRGKHSHCSVQLVCDYDFYFTDNAENYKPQKNGIVLPFVTSFYEDTEQLKKDLFVIVSDLAVSKEKNEMSCAILTLSILQKLSANYLKQYGENTWSIIQHRVKKFVANNIDKQFGLADISKELNMTPNYINSVFVKQCGISIRQYINKEKVNLICELMQHRKIPFKTACENVGIYDVSYGYRLFKKNMGITTKEYLNSIK